jgi:AraC-like DNA-binding protein
MSTRSVLGFVYTLQGLKALGVKVAPILAHYSIDLDRLSPDAEIDRSLELRIFNDIVPALPDAATGIKIGSTMSLAGYGPFIMLLMTCQNAWEAFRAGVHYQQLTYIFGEFALEPGERETSLCIRNIPLPATCRRFLVDRDMSGTYQLTRDIQAHIGIDIRPVAVHVPYPKPKEFRLYEERYGCPVTFDAPEARFVVRTEDLSRRFPAANPTAYSLYRQQCDLLLAKREAQLTGLGHQVADYLDLFVEVFPSSEEVASAFGLSERSFRRRLSEEATSFRKLLDQVRFRKARQLLAETAQSMESIARQLGYAESAAFIHAFQRWAGTSPAVFRAEGNGKRSGV